MKAKLLTLLVLVLTTLTAVAQQNAVTIFIEDKANGEPIPFVNCQLLMDSITKAGAATDFDGKAKISPVPAGQYELRLLSVGYTEVSQQVTVSEDGTELRIEMEPSLSGCSGLVVVEYEVPLIDNDAGASGATVTREDIAKMPPRTASCCGTGIYCLEPKLSKREQRKKKRAHRKALRKAQ